MISLDPHAIGVVLDVHIAERLAVLEQQVRADLAASGPEDESALDVPPDVEADWQRITLEEILVIERERLEFLRDQLLASGMR